jgi:uncharacterized membrane protein
VENELTPESGREVEPLHDPAPVIATTPTLAAAASAPVPAAPEVPAYRDRGTGLVLFGVVQIILGLLTLLMVPLVMLTAFMSRLAPGGAMRPGQYVSSVALYIFLSAVLLTLGVGSVQMKRWARALTLVTSWYWLIVGVVATVALTAFLPVGMRSAMAQAQQNAANTSPPEVTTGIMAVIITLFIVVFAFFLVLMPIAFIAFYGRKDVELTCRQRDPVERWTDRAPLPVLGASAAFFSGATYSLLLGLTAPMFPFFGRYLTGFPAAGCLLAFAALDLYLAVALFRLQSSAWWIAVLATPVRMLAVALSYSRAGLMQAYSKMGWSDAQLQMLNSNPIFHSRIILWYGVIFMLAFFGYLLWLKRYYKTTPALPPTEALSTQAV